MTFTTANTGSFIHKEQYGKKKKKATNTYNKSMAKKAVPKFKKMATLKITKGRKR
jgi:hypothetical protein